MELLQRSVSIPDSGQWSKFQGFVRSDSASDRHVWPHEIQNKVEQDTRIHRTMLANASGGADAGFYPQCYFRFTQPTFVTPSSSLDNSVQSAALFDAAGDTLEELASGQMGDPNFETAAAETAKTLLQELRAARLPAPELSWHGGDAVVMLWALKSTTYAITVTAGEIGYVVRENRKTVKLRDSIAIDQFKVAQLTHGS